MPAGGATPESFASLDADLHNSKRGKRAPDALHHVINFLMTHVEDGAPSSVEEIFQVGDQLDRAVRHLVAQFQPENSLDFEKAAKKFDGVTAVSLAGAFLLKFVSRIEFSLMPMLFWWNFGSLGKLHERLTAFAVQDHVMKQFMFDRRTLGHLIQLMRLLQWRHTAETAARSRASVKAAADADAEFLFRFVHLTGDKIIYNWRECRHLLQFMADNADTVFKLYICDKYYHRCDDCLYTRVAERRLDRTFWYEGQYVPAIVTELTQYMMDRPQHCAEVLHEADSPAWSNGAIEALEHKYNMNPSINVWRFFIIRGVAEGERTVQIACTVLMSYLHRVTESRQLLTLPQLRTLHLPSLHPSVRGVIKRIAAWLKAMQPVSKTPACLLQLAVPSLVLVSKESSSRGQAEVKEAAALFERLLASGQLD